jgi:hypothetical protein
MDLDRRATLNRLFCLLQYKDIVEVIELITQTCFRLLLFSSLNSSQFCVCTVCHTGYLIVYDHSFTALSLLSLRLSTGI